MLQKWLSKLGFIAPAPSPSARPQSQPAGNPVQGNPAQAARPPAYPPVDRGLPIATAIGVLAANQELMNRLRLHAAVEPDVFALRFEGPLLSLAEQVNVLPATASSLFSGEGGLFRAALEMAFYSFQAGDGRIFTGNETVERRHALEGRWRYVCFLAGMFYPLGKTLDNIVVTSEQGQTWRRHFGSLTSWAVDHSVERIFATWPAASEIEQEIGPSSHIASIIATVVGAQNLQWLDDGSPELVKALYEISSGSPTTAGNCRDVVHTMWERISRREEARRPQAFGRQTVGTHMGPYLVGAIRALLATEGWKLNADKVKADQSGLYLVWPQAIEDIARFGKEQGYSGWPANAATIAELLKSCQIVTQDGEDLGMHEVVADSGEILSAFKLRNPLAVLEDFDPDAYAEQSPKTLQGVVAADPLAPAEAQAEAAAATPKAHVQSKAVESRSPKPDAVLEQQQSIELEHGAAPLEAEPEPEPVSRRPQGGEPSEHVIESEPSDSAGPVPIREAAEVRYSDLVPQEVQRDIKKRLHVELLGKVMKAWQDRGQSSKSMRMTDNGAAISVETLATLVRDVPAWVGEMAAAGLIYSPPATPGLKIIKVAIPEGSKPKEAIVLSRFAVKKLGL